MECRKIKGCLDNIKMYTLSKPEKEEYDEIVKELTNLQIVRISNSAFLANDHFEDVKMLSAKVDDLLILV